MHRFVGELRETLFACLNPLLPIEPPYALVDVPNHSNVGDSAILCELAWLKAIGAPRPDYICDIYSYRESDLRQRVPHGTILIHGGGYLGDLWKAQQTLREQIVSAFPDHRIVQLPQTIHFQSPAALERAAALFSNHKQLTIVARDRVSFDLASARLKCRALLAPDCALALGAIPRPSLPRRMSSGSRGGTKSLRPCPFPSGCARWTGWAQQCHDSDSSRTLALGAQNRPVAPKPTSTAPCQGADVTRLHGPGPGGHGRHRSAPCAHPLPNDGHSARGHRQQLREDPLVPRCMDARRARSAVLRGLVRG